MAVWPKEHLMSRKRRNHAPSLKAKVAQAAASMPDLVGRDFTATAPGQKFVGDITYIHTWAGFIYLVTVIDCYSKKVVGWSIADGSTVVSVTPPQVNVRPPTTRLSTGNRDPQNSGRKPRTLHGADFTHEPGSHTSTLPNQRQVFSNPFHPATTSKSQVTALQTDSQNTSG